MVTLKSIHKIHISEYTILILPFINYTDLGTLLSLFSAMQPVFYEIPLTLCPTVYQPAWAAITKYYKLSGLNNRHFFFSQFWRFEVHIKVLVNSVLRRAFLLTSRWLSSSYVFTWPFLRVHGEIKRDRRIETERLCSLISLYIRTLILSGLHPYICIRLQSLPQKPHLQTQPHWGLGCQCMNWGNC